MFIEGSLYIENNDKIIEVLLVNLDTLEVVDRQKPINNSYSFIVKESGRFIVHVKMSDEVYKTAFYSEVINGKDYPIK